VPTIPEGIYDADGTYVSVVKMIQPDADELFRRLREGRPLGELGTDLAQTPPSPANIVTSVVSSGAGPEADEVLTVLTEGGFNTSPGIVDASSIALPKKGSMILYRNGAEAMAKVVGTYFTDLELVPAPPGSLGAGEDVAVVVTAGYQVPDPNENPPVECPAA
jgi:hypothetical protein